MVTLKLKDIADVLCSRWHHTLVALFLPTFTSALLHFSLPKNSLSKKPTDSLSRIDMVCQNEANYHLISLGSVMASTSVKLKSIVRISSVFNSYGFQTGR